MHVDGLVDAASSLNWQTIISIFVVMWYFTHDIKREVKLTHEDLKLMNTRIGRVEGTVYGKDIYKTIEKD